MSDAGAACKALRAQIPDSGAPNDLSALARAAGVRRIRMAKIPVDGMLTRAGDGWIVTIAIAAAPVRQRYTLAHEIGHAVLGSTAECIGTDSHDQVERAANEFAAEALLPSEQFHSSALNVPMSAASVQELARFYRVSRDTVARRLCELKCWSVAVIRWREQDRPGSTRKLRVAWSVTPPGSRIFIPRFAPSTGQLRATSASGPDEFTAALNLGTLRGEFRILVAQRTKTEVLTLVVL